MYQRRKDTIREDNGNSNIHTLNDINNNNNNNNNNNYNNYNQNDFNNGNNIWDDLEEFRFYDSSRHDFIKTNKCLICYSEFNENDIVQKLVCGHIFHKDCLNNQNLEVNRRDLVCQACFDWVYQNY